MYPFYKKIKPFFLVLTVLLATQYALGQPCTPQGDENTAGTNNTWIAYMYQGINFNNYKGYVNRGTAGSPAFDESFGGNQATFTTNGCAVYTDTFSVRFKLTKTFSDANYLFTVGGDDGFRLSIDGGATWLINRWNDQGYTTETNTIQLNGTYNLVLEFYERYGANRISFDVVAVCTGDGNPAVYGATNAWIGYLYQGNNFAQYKGYIAKGNGSNMNFDESFGSSNGTFATSNCSITTEYFSARFRSRTTLTGNYSFTVGGDDGYRLSLDGGSTWIINEWQAQSYKVTSRTINNLNGNYDMVLEFYENTGSNRLSFSMTQLTVLPVTLMDWNARVTNANNVLLSWQTADAVNFDKFIVQKSNDGLQFRDVAIVPAKTDNQVQTYTHTDQQVSNKTWYRLAMVDKDGSVRYSALVVASIKQTESIRIYPTLVENKQLFIESGKKINQVMVELIDMNGRVLQAEQRNLSVGKQTLQLQGGAAGNARGAYIIRITGQEGVLTKQSVIIR
jgi:hypothetical protein